MDYPADIECEKNQLMVLCKMIHAMSNSLETVLVSDELYDAIRAYYEFAMGDLEYSDTRHEYTPEVFQKTLDSFGSMPSRLV